MTAFTLLLAMLFIGACEERSESTAHLASDGYERSWSSDGARATLTLDRTELTVAESLRLTIRVDAPVDAEIEVEGVTDAVPRDWRVQTPSAESRDIPAGAPRIFEFQLEPFLPGEYRIEPIQIAIRSTRGGDTRAEYETEPITITVRSVIPEGVDDTEPAAIRGVIEPHRIDWTPWLWAILLFGVVLMAFAIWRMLNSGRVRRSDGVRPLPAHLVALRELDALIGEGLIERGDFKRYYARLTAIVRRYIEQRFGLRAPERTTEEFLHEAREAGLFRGVELEQFEQFLFAADLVKFAKHEPTRRQADEAAGTARRFIEQSAPRVDDSGSSFA
ncbi:MAG: BatD family protein [Phycisphaerales bacterium]